MDLSSLDVSRPNVGRLPPLGIVSRIYLLIQAILSWLFAPLPPSQHADQKPLGHVAVVGTGITGISTASHLLGHGFEVTIFTEDADESHIGGIWSRVNSTSGLQISSIMYRFHPSVKYSTGYPKRDEILANVRAIWDKYDLQRRTRFGTTVKQVTRHEPSSTDPKDGGHARWIVNGDESVVFDGIVAATGTCGTPKKMDMEGQENFQGQIVHSSQLDDVELHDKKVIIIGGGASGVEALELAIEKNAKTATILARSDKWIIPRTMLVDLVLSLQPLGRETFLSIIPEFLLRRLHYRDLAEKMSPTQGFYTGTPIVNSSCFEHIRRGRADYIRGDVQRATQRGVSFNLRPRGSRPGDKGTHIDMDADVIVIATGFNKPTLDFLPADLFPEDYVRPNMYLQNFPVNDCSVLCTNATFKDAVGTVGNWHIGIYARIFMVFLMDPNCRPKPKDMRLWVDLVRFIKENAPGGGLEFFTYAELVLWMVTFLFFRLSRVRYAFFVILGLGFWSRNKRAAQQPKFHLSISKLIPHFPRKINVLKALGGPARSNAHAPKTNGVKAD
ncbi:FAD/NAD(P)-binding domain-containing protein [Tilletiaria anomala UBC 951]|uniref:FAD/NAD(P)-binding domain-containing protein n=1 Tax=Tilletiaria anomala (strain ATCC 24038 / CBS 436.72 / UBC 951) TaxID=1037660 RepID=A0A066WBK3_TILAU|nr:FAD/NAD(P)-binding domain-containing protein [Tilletiaria anomala UBC 951]KDN48464.1 FAD/NAD(P)-binding domain-containing protein [Tilletiaria anomala UBC 951]